MDLDQFDKQEQWFILSYSLETFVYERLKAYYSLSNEGVHGIIE